MTNEIKTEGWGSISKKPLLKGRGSFLLPFLLPVPRMQTKIQMLTLEDLSWAMKWHSRWSGGAGSWTSDDHGAAVLALKCLPPVFNEKEKEFVSTTVTLVLVLSSSEAAPNSSCCKLSLMA